MYVYLKKIIIFNFVLNKDWFKKYDGIFCDIKVLIILKKIGLDKVMSV